MYYDRKYPHRRKHPRDVFDWLVTKQMRYVTFSASEECREMVASEMYRLTLRLCVVCFWIGVGAGAVGTILAYSH